MTTRKHPPSPFGQRLIFFRELVGLSQEQLAQNSGLSIGIIQKLEQGRTADPRLTTLLQLAKGLKLSVLNLLYLPTEPDRSCLTDRDPLSGSDGSLDAGRPPSQVRDISLEATQ